MLLALNGCSNPAENTNSDSISDTTINVLAPDEAGVQVTPDSVNATAQAAPDFHLLAGDWIRNDGDYTIRVQKIAADGNLEASYFNPQPIHVGKSKWEITAANLFIMVELQDANYPGSAYTLQYFPTEDKLAGNYFQAVEGANYQVVFDRKK